MLKKNIILVIWSHFLLKFELYSLKKPAKGFFEAPKTLKST